MGNPAILNLDEVETIESDIKIVHKGESHAMAILTVDRYIEQQKRATRQANMIAANEIDEADGTDIVELMKASIGEFFPTLPVGELETAKLFSIFAWLNQLSAQVNENASADVVEAAEGDEGNEPGAETNS